MVLVKECVSRIYVNYFEQYSDLDSVPEVQDFYEYGDNIENYDRADLVLVHLARDYFLIPNKPALEHIEYVDSKLRISEFTELGKLLSNFK